MAARRPLPIVIEGDSNHICVKEPVRAVLCNCEYCSAKLESKKCSDGGDALVILAWMTEQLAALEGGEEERGRRKRRKRKKKKRRSTASASRGSRAVRAAIKS